MKGLAQPANELPFTVFDLVFAVRPSDGRNSLFEALKRILFWVHAPALVRAMQVASQKLLCQLLRSLTLNHDSVFGFNSTTMFSGGPVTSRLKDAKKKT